MSRRNPIMFSKPDEPLFLRKIKAQIGFKEGPNVDTKNEELPKASEDDLNDRDDERPVVVIPKNSRVTEEEAQEFITNQEGEEIGLTKKDDDDTYEEKESRGRLMFKKPNKVDREDSSKAKIHLASKRKTKNDLTSSSSRSKIVKVNDNRLLSFGDDEEED